MGNSDRQNVISASDTSIGFDYQFYYFFYLTLGLKHGEKIGLEEKDDVHVELSNGDLILIQTKHTLQTRSDGESINLTERDKDLWKTISNWTKIINEQASPLDYVKKTTFQLISNKSLASNQFIINLKQLAEDDINVSYFKSYLKSLHDSTTDKTICNYINEFKAIKAALLKEFVMHIGFEFNQDDLIRLIKQRILEKIYQKNRVDDVYVKLHSELRDTNYLSVKNGTKNVIGFEDFINKFRKCFQVAMSDKLPVRSFQFSLPENPEEQLFIKQLIHIRDISIEDREEIIEFTTQLLQLYNNLKTWEDDGDLLPSELKKFNEETIQIWKNNFKAKYRKIKHKINSGNSIEELNDNIKETAVSLLDEMRNKILKIDDTILSTELSNGHLYLLTESQEIGWQYDWKKTE
ncbi:hypothetical protein K4L44_03770 [Halosquirtibacter laminarini]|uniref:Uncharacterized protein n=1 Tax=Halosquirtibacter laminarini TaxID=3374600 RepID=A0AC61NKC3_9BACT|nr:hypothetical protein K4L44_03770 [Prolixibacteraceae bacterium]